MAERQLPKLNVAGSIPVSRSSPSVLALLVDHLETAVGEPILPADRDGNCEPSIARIDLHAIDCLPVEMDGTAFQREVRRALREIPCGTGSSMEWTEFAQVRPV